MADQTITTQGVILYDRWPGKNCVTTPDVENISDMTSTLVGHNQQTAKYPLGTKWQLYNYGAAVNVGVKYHRGFSTFIYLKAESTATTAVALSAAMLVAPYGTLAAGMDRNALYTVTASSSRTTHETMGLTAMCLSTMTNSYYGWFWCGGVCPLEYVPGLSVTSTIVTNDSLYTASTITAITTVASIATSVGLMAPATDGQTQICGEALYADQT